jgi:hypothetical protein
MFGIFMMFTVFRGTFDSGAWIGRVSKLTSDQVTSLVTSKNYQMIFK